MEKHTLLYAIEVVVEDEDQLRNLRTDIIATHICDLPEVDAVISYPPVDVPRPRGTVEALDNGSIWIGGHTPTFNRAHAQEFAQRILLATTAQEQDTT